MIYINHPYRIFSKMNTLIESRVTELEEEKFQNETCIKMSNIIQKIYLDAENDFQQYLNNPNSNLLKIIKDKYPFLRRQNPSKRQKKIEAKLFIHEILENPEYAKYVEEFTIEQKNIIYKNCISKIKGLYKHAQALKTGYCNKKIINGFSEEKTISICLTKNTLEANEQWLERLFKELDNRFPHVKLNDKIMIISSKKNDLKGNATHCKDIKTAWSHLKRNNKFRILFICSNKIRISDILEISEDFQNLHIDLQKNLRIFHDEAHNPKEGIPPYRDLIENIIIQPNVLEYIPITASNHPINDENNPLWQKQNLEKLALDYTIDFDKTKSDHPSFSSCSKANQISFETLRKHANWKDYNIDKIPKDSFMKIDENKFDIWRNTLNTYDLDNLREELTKEIKIFKNSNISTDLDIDMIVLQVPSYSKSELIENIINLDIERRRTLEFCYFMKNDQEKEAVNNALNCFNMNELLETTFYLANEFNLHIISTPNRKALTRYLCEEAIRKDYKPIVLGIYGNEGEKYNLFWDLQEEEVSFIMDKGEFNEKLYKLFTYLKEKKVNINRPFIIIGNYNPTGESITFVHYKYGTIRSVICLNYVNAEKSYQIASRENYMIAKFVEENPNWIMPEKYLIGPRRFLVDALSYEAENDARIDTLCARTTDTMDEPILLSSTHEKVSRIETDGIVAIPIRITVDTGDSIVKEMLEILDNTQRTAEDKINLLRKLKKYKESGECQWEDTIGKFDFDDFTIKVVRCYKKKDKEPGKGVWKFSSYQNHFGINTGFMNDVNIITKNECEILTCKDTYLLKNENGVEIEKNLKSVWWIGYKY